MGRDRPRGADGRWAVPHTCNPLLHGTNKAVAAILRSSASYTALGPAPPGMVVFLPLHGPSLRTGAARVRGGWGAAVAQTKIVHGWPKLRDLAQKFD